MKRKMILLFSFILMLLMMLPYTASAHPGALDELGGHFRRSDCIYFLHKPTSIAMQAKNKQELLQLIKKYNSNSACVSSLTVDKIDLDGNTLGGGTAPSSGSQDSSNSSTKPSTKPAPKSSTNDALEIGKKYPATLSRCVDGDTAYFTINGKTYNTRFLFVDTPESTRTVEPYGKEASQYTCSRLKSGNIYLETDGPSLYDKYNRLLAWVWVGNRLLQEDLAKEGLVEDFYDYGQYKYEDRVREALAAAKANGVGMYKSSDDQEEKASASQSSEKKNKAPESKQESQSSSVAPATAEPKEQKDDKKTVEDKDKSTPEDSKAADKDKENADEKENVDKKKNADEKEKKSEPSEKEIAAETNMVNSSQQSSGSMWLLFILIIFMIWLFFRLTAMKLKAGIRPLISHRMCSGKRIGNLLLGILYLFIWPIIIMLTLIEALHFVIIYYRRPKDQILEK
jgi:micrococcal nuclease